MMVSILELVNFALSYFSNLVVHFCCNVSIHIYTLCFNCIVVRVAYKSNYLFYS
jgi:hypothetical protein